MASLTTKDVFLFYPNIIGYLRIVFMMLSFYFARSSWIISFFCYGFAFFGDVVDGYVARHFNQCSKFGGVLDMVTDRVSTCGLLTILASLYPDYAFYAATLIVIDIFSHWFHVLSVSGHHKSSKELENRNALLKWYYSVYPLFGYCCVGTELFYIILYVLYFYPDPLLQQLCFYGCLPACVLKQIVNVVQFVSAAEVIAMTDVTESKEKSVKRKK